MPKFSLSINYFPPIRTVNDESVFPFPVEGRWSVRRAYERATLHRPTPSNRPMPSCAQRKSLLKLLDYVNTTYTVVGVDKELKYVYVKREDDGKFFRFLLQRLFAVTVNKAVSENMGARSEWNVRKWQVETDLHELPAISALLKCNIEVRKEEHEVDEPERTVDICSPPTPSSSWESVGDQPKAYEELQARLRLEREERQAESEELRRLHAQAHAQAQAQVALQAERDRVRALEDKLLAILKAEEKKAAAEMGAAEKAAAEAAAAEAAAAEAAAAEKEAVRLAAAKAAQVLVMISDHGSGTTNLGAALKAHPCVMDLGEPFGPSFMLWAKSKVTKECEDELSHDAMFDADTGKLEHAENPKMKEKIDDALFREDFTDGTKKPNIDTSKLYKGLKYNLADYFVRVRDLVCENVPESVCPREECTVLLKMFPNYVYGDTATPPADCGARCQCMKEQNKNALRAWNDMLTAFEQEPKISTFQFNRNEQARLFSIFHRFSPTGEEFDCSIPHLPTPYALAAADHTDAQLQAEDCWKDPAKCLSDALELVGLTTEKMTDETMDEMMAEMLAGPQQTHLDADSRSCSTDPKATFKRLANDQVDLVRKGPKDDKDDKDALTAAAAAAASEAIEIVKENVVMKATVKLGDAPQAARPEDRDAPAHTVNAIGVPSPTKATRFTIAAPAPAKAATRAPAPTKAATRAPAPTQAGRAQVLVIISDHGSGTTDFGVALNTHPCILDLMEPFGDQYVLWSSSKIDECENKHPQNPAIFDADSGVIMAANNYKLNMTIERVLNKFAEPRRGQRTSAPATSRLRL